MSYYERKTAARLGVAIHALMFGAGLIIVCFLMQWVGLL